MVSRWMSRSPSPPPDDEPAVSDSQCHRDLPNTTPSFLNSWTFPYSASSIPTNIQDGRSPSIGTRTGTSPNINAAHSTSGVTADTLGYPSNTSTYPAYSDRHTESNVSSNGYSFQHRESTNLSIMDGTTWRKNNDPTTGFIPNESYELQSSSGYGSPIYNPPIYHGPQYHNTVQEDVDVSYSRTPVPGSNLPPQMQYLDHNTPYPPQHISPNADASSSSHCGSFSGSCGQPPSSSHRGSSSSSYGQISSGSCGQPSSSSHRGSSSSSYGQTSSSSHRGSSSSSYGQTSSSSCRQPSSNFHHGSSSSSYREQCSSSHYRPFSHHREPSLNLELSGHDPSEDFIIYYPQVAGTEFPEQPGPSMAPLPSAATHSHSRQNFQYRRTSDTYRVYHSPSTIFSCDWLVGENTTCGFKGPLDAFKAHFRHSHLSGTQDAPNACRWQGCNYRKRDNASTNVMRRDCLLRHVKETHLGVKRNV